MARIHGRDGRLYVGLASDTAAAEPVAFLTSWEINSDVDKVDVTAFGDLNKTNVAGLPNRGGTYAGWYDTANAQLWTAASDGLARKFYLYPSIAAAFVTTYWHGTGIFDMSVSGGADSAVSISGSYEAVSDIIQKR